MKKYLIFLSLLVSVAYGQNTHVAPTGIPSPSSLGSNMHHYGRVFNVVSDYGADNTGVADATTQIQAAINACFYGLSWWNSILPKYGLYKIAGSIQTSVTFGSTTL